MAKKKDKPQVINNIQELNLEIDYEKFAKAIVKAQDEAKKVKKRPDRFRAVGMVAVNTAIHVIIAIFIVIAFIVMWVNFSSDKTPRLFECIVYSILFIVIIAAQIFSAIESWKDDDENAIKHFNTNVALVALIVSLIALLKGVG